MAHLERLTNARNDQVNKIIVLLKYEIIFGRLRPRERLIEDELCSQFSTSRHVVRAAFVALEHMGLVTRRPNKGAAVRDFSVEEVEEMYEMRALLQAEAGRRIPLPASPELLDRVRALHAQYSKAVAERDLGLVCTINNRFHHAIFEACGNRYLVQMIERIWTETLAIRCYAIGDPALLARSRREHERIIAALAEGNRERLVREVVDHIWPALEAYKRAHGGWNGTATAAHASGVPERAAG